MCVCVFTATTGALLCTNMEKYQTIRKHTCIFVREGVSANVAICMSDSVFQAASLPLKKIHQRESLVCLCRMFFTKHPSFLLASHWIPAGVHWGATTHRASVTNEGESVLHRIENSSGSLQSSLKMH